MNIANKKGNNWSTNPIKRFTDNKSTIELYVFKRYLNLKEGNAIVGF